MHTAYSICRLFFPVIIEADSEIALDYDTVLFDSDRNAIGQVTDFSVVFLWVDNLD